MYLENPPGYFYPIVAILAIVLTLFICVRLFDYIVEVWPRRRRTRRFLSALNDRGIDEGVRSWHEQQERDALIDEVKRVAPTLDRQTNNDEKK